MTNSDRDSTRDFGRLVRQLRGSDKQATYAKQLGISRSHLANVEGGLLPSARVLDALLELHPEEAQELRTTYREGRAGKGSGAAPPPSESRVDEEDLDFEMFFKRSGASPKLEGEWYALWQTTVDDVENINSELLTFSWRSGYLYISNSAPSDENPKGGYLWRAQCRLSDNQFITGTYSAVEPVVRFKGVIYLVLHGSGKYMLGHWVGCNYDSDWAHGLVAIARDDKDLPSLLKRHTESFPAMPYWPAPGDEKSVVKKGDIK